MSRFSFGCTSLNRKFGIGAQRYAANGNHTSRVRGQSHQRKRTFYAFAIFVPRGPCPAGDRPRLPIHFCTRFQSMPVNRTCYNSEWKSGDDSAGQSPTECQSANAENEATRARSRVIAYSAPRERQFPLS